MNEKEEMRFTSLEYWKAIAMSKLIALCEKYSNDIDKLGHLEFLMTKIQYTNDIMYISDTLYYMHKIAREYDIKELYEIIPTMEEIIEMFKRALKHNK